MNESEREERGEQEAEPRHVKRPYERPQIAWREPYDPVSFGVSCAKQPANPGCNPGPFAS